MKVKITLTEEVLGTASSDREIHATYVASKAADAKKIEEEVEAIGAEAVTEKAMTIFPKEDGKPFIWDYQIRGFFKDSCSALARVPGTRSNKLKAFRKVIDGTIFVNPRKIMLQIPEGAELGNCQRPLRAQTAQGERIALANSETVPAGTVLEFEIVIMDESHEAVVSEWLNYGKFRGLGQWRNSGKGRFDWVKLD